MVEFPGSARPVVHIGYHKTATTWFQERIWPSVTSHEYVDRHTTQRALLNPPGLHFDAEAARERLRLDERAQPVLLSEENLSGYIHNGGLHGLIGPEMARRIREILPDARIMIFIRNQPDIVRASYAQYVSGGGTWSLRRYLAGKAGRHGALTRAYKAPAFEWEHFDYDALIGYYEALFGPENVHVYPYEWLRDRTSLLDRMAGDLGITFGETAETADRANTSLGSEALLLLRFANLFTRQSVINKTTLVDLPGGQGLRHAAKWVLKRMPSRRFVLPADTRAHIASYYAVSNARLAGRRGLPLADLGYPLAQAIGQAHLGDGIAKDAA